MHKLLKVFRQHTVSVIVGLVLAVSVVILFAASDDHWTGGLKSDYDIWRIDSSGNLIPGIDDTYDIGDSSHEIQDINVDGTATIDTLTVDGAATVGTTLDVTGTTTVGTLTTTGTATIATLAVTNTATITGAATVGTTLGVTGNTTLSGTSNSIATTTMTGVITIYSLSTRPSSGYGAGAIIFCTDNQKFYGATGTVTSTADWAAFN